MHKIGQFVLAAGMLTGTASLAVAQSEPTAFVYATYYRCGADQARADTLVRRSIGPILDKYVTSGGLSSWGWMSHSTGGEWRRVAYLVAPTRDQLLDTEARIGQETDAMGARNPMLSLNAICPSHDDYVWANIGSAEGAPPAGTQRQPVSLSTYYECDMSKEARADEIFTNVLAPIYNKHMKAGHFKNWSWFRHELGGHARRLATMDGPDAKTVLNAWDMVFNEAAETAPLAFQEFLAACPTHNDYIWNVMIFKP